MGCPMMRHHRQIAGGEGGFGPQGVMFVPAPMAVFGTLIAFMFGVMLGAGLAKKHATSAGGMGMGGMCGKPWMKRGMHHHHGYGMPECREWHGEWHEPEGEASEQSAE